MLSFPLHALQGFSGRAFPAGRLLLAARRVSFFGLRNQLLNLKRLGLNDRPFIRWEEAMISAELMAKIKALNKSMQESRSLDSNSGDRHSALDPHDE